MPKKPPAYLALVHTSLERKYKTDPLQWITDLQLTKERKDRETGSRENREREWGRGMERRRERGAGCADMAQRGESCRPMSQRRTKRRGGEREEGMNRESESDSEKRRTRRRKEREREGWRGGHGTTSRELQQD